MKKVFLAVFILLATIMSAQTTTPVTTQQFCDNQQGLVEAMKPMVDQIAANIVPPYGRTTADVSNFISMGLAFGIGERCVMMRLADQLISLQQQINDLQVQAATAVTQSQSALTTAAAAANTATAASTQVTTLANTVKAAGTTLSSQ